VQPRIRAVLAFMAHTGGFITGYVLAFILRGHRVAQAVPDQPQGFEIFSVIRDASECMSGGINKDSGLHRKPRNLPATRYESLV
jgi:hypothetical protein